MDNLKQRLKSNQVVLGTMISEIATPNIMRMFSAVGFDYVIIDCEHGYFDLSQVASMVSVASGCGLPVIVRTPNAGRESITKVLDMGAEGILVPMVSTVEEAQSAVQHAKYAPLGNRGISTTRAHTSYQPPALNEYMKLANDRTVVLVQIETRLAARNAADIAAIDGIDALMIGPNDLAADFGCPGDFDAERINLAIGQVLRAAKAHHKPCGLIASDISFLNRWKEKGMTVFSCSSEVGMLMSRAKQIRSEFINA